MNSAVLNLRPYCSSRVKAILFFYSVGPAYFSSYIFSFSFSWLSSVSHSCSPTISLSLFFIHRHPQLKTMVVVVRKNCEEDEVEFVVCGSLLLIGLAGLRWFSEHGCVSTGVLGFGGFCDLILGEKFQKYALSNFGSVISNMGL